MYNFKLSLLNNDGLPGSGQIELTGDYNFTHPVEAIRFLKAPGPG
jgi:hypothetical protein